MWNNIGGKIKGLAKVVCWIGIIGSIIGGIVMIIAGASMSSRYNSDAKVIYILSGFGMMVLGSLFSWIGRWLTYGLGQLIQNSDELVSLKKKDVRRKTTYVEEE